MHVEGIHHITAISSDPQKTYDFYTKVLGLRLVKKTVNQDDTSTYHLFFGDRTGSPGMDLTFFTFLPPMQGLTGLGQVTSISFAVPEKSIDFWTNRLRTMNINHTSQQFLFGNKTIRFKDFDNQHLQIVGLTENELLTSEQDLWITNEISENEAIRHFHSATLSVLNQAMIEPVISEMGYELQKVEGHKHLYKVPSGQKGEHLIVDVSPDLENGINAAGTVHHIAFRVPDEATQIALREKIFKIGLYPTEVIDRYYFKSVYFRTPAGILFEIATNGPGFTTDEDESTLGEKLALPPFLEDQREEIEKRLPKIEI